jgi:phospholipid/cholesterol/gamma-HCH transport system substrate-binding protein
MRPELPGPPAPQSAVRPLVGLAGVLLIVAVVAVSLTSFRSGFTDSARVTVVSPRAGLVMDPDAKVKMLGVQVGTVDSIAVLPDGSAELQLAMDPSRLKLIPANVLVDIASTTVFGAKFVQLVPPAEPSLQSLRAGQVLDAKHVTVEINTVFQQLTSLLAQIEPAKLNETLGAFSRALSGRGDKLGQGLSDFDALLAKMDPALPALRHDLAVAPGVLNTYADTSNDLLRMTQNASRISQTFVDEQQHLDALLVSVIGLADIGEPFLADNRAALKNVLDLLVPTTALTDQYSPALNCGFNGFLDLANVAESVPDATSLVVSVNFLFGHDRYRYPQDLPKVAAKGGPQCSVLPVRYQTHPPYVVTDTGTNPYKNGNPGLVLNSDGLKQLLFGPLDGPPRNSAQIGQPG